MVYNLYRHLRDFFLAPISSLLLVLSFPNFDQGFLAWVGLLPLLIAIHDKSLRVGFFLSLVSGILFFLGIFYWILEVQGYTLFHHGLLAVYLGLYFGLFGLVVKLISKRLSILAAFFAAPFIWVSLEYIRSNLSFLALPWALLAHSQYKYPMVIQIASLAGTYSISFLVVLVNTALAAIVLSFKEDLQIQRRSNFKTHPAFPLPKKGAMLPSLKKGNKREFQIYKARKIMAVTTALLMIFTLLYGYWSISKPVAGTEIKVSLVQGNIEQTKKWDPRYAQEIMDIYTRLTLEASKDRPTMIIWPETATPGSISLDVKINNGVENIAKEAGTYLLVGSAQHQKFLRKESSKLKYSNSAYLIHPSPGMVRNQRYDKIRLFPFGEYLPFKEIIPWTFINVRDSGVYIPGAEFTIFKLPHFRFGVTICWENVFPDLFLQFVRSGAQVMVNITNEARFEKTAAPYQLASISVFRAVENRIFVIRCANTGVSCIINPYGQIVDRVKDGKGEDTFVRGVMSGRITPLDSKTIYTRCGDWFVWVAIPVSAAFLVFAIFKASLWKLGS